MKLTLAERDLQLLQIENEIANKKKLLVKKRREFDKKQKINNYLHDVKEDYSKYYNYILNEKQQQYKAFSLLNEYINDLLKTEDMVDEQLITAKHDQKDIIREINKVKKELDEIVE